MRAWRRRARSTLPPRKISVQSSSCSKKSSSLFRVVPERGRFTLTRGFRCGYDFACLVPAGLAARPRRGYFFRTMPNEPDTKRAVSFIDGQNLYRHAKDAFGHHHPNYDPRRLADAVCADRGWLNHEVRFYTGVPSAERAPMWHGYWTRRLTAITGSPVTSRNNSPMSGSIENRRSFYPGRRSSRSDDAYSLDPRLRDPRPGSPRRPPHTGVEGPRPQPDRCVIFVARSFPIRPRLEPAVHDGDQWFDSLAARNDRNFPLIIPDSTHVNRGPRGCMVRRPQ